MSAITRITGPNAETERDELLHFLEDAELVGEPGTLHTIIVNDVPDLWEAQPDGSLRHLNSITVIELSTVHPLSNDTSGILAALTAHKGTSVFAFAQRGQEVIGSSNGQIF